MERKVSCVGGRGRRSAQEGTGYLMVGETSELECGCYRKTGHPLNIKEVISSNWKVADVTHAVSAGQVLIRTFKAVSFSFPALLPSFLCPPFICYQCALGRFPRL